MKKKTEELHKWITEEDFEPLSKGQTVVIRTVTYHCIGTVVRTTSRGVILFPVGYLANSPRWGEFLDNGIEGGEFERVNKPNYVMRDVITDVWPWDFPVPETFPK